MKIGREQKENVVKEQNVDDNVIEEQIINEDAEHQIDQTHFLETPKDKSRSMRRILEKYTEKDNFEWVQKTKKPLSVIQSKLDETYSLN